MASPLPNKKWLVALLSHVRCPLIRKSQEPLEQASQEPKNDKALEDWDQKLVSKSVWVMCFFVPFRKSNILCHHEAVTDFCRIRLGHRLGLLTAPRQSYKLTPSQRPPLAVGSLASCNIIILGHSVDFKSAATARSIHQKRASRLGIQSNKTKK